MRFVEANKSPIERLAIVGAKHVESERLSRPRITLPSFKQLMDGDEVAEALRHLLPFDLEEAVMHPDLRHDLGAVRAARLRDLILMMRKDEVDAPAVNIEHVAEKRLGHGRALDVPARTPARSDAAG